MVKGKGRDREMSCFILLVYRLPRGLWSISLLPAPISYTKYSSPIVFSALISVIECQGQINPAVFLNVGELDFKEVGKRRKEGGGKGERDEGRKENRKEREGNGGWKVMKERKNTLKT